MIDIPSSGPAGEMPFTDIFDMDAQPHPSIPDGPIIVAVARDEMPRLPDYLRHHRAIGIRHFLIVDNGSTDGSAEYLDAQPDVTRFFSKRHFPTFKQVFRPWLADTYGDGRWVLAPDVDTRCPDRAGDLARHLVSCGRILRENNALAGLRQSEIREKVQAYFKAQLDQYLDWLDGRGLSKNALADDCEEILDHESFLELETDFPKWLPVTRFKRVMDVSDEQWDASQPQITFELRKGHRDMLRHVLEAAERLEHCSYDNAPAIFPAAPEPARLEASPSPRDTLSMAGLEKWRPRFSKDVIVSQCLDLIIAAQNWRLPLVRN